MPSGIFALLPPWRGWASSIRRGPRRRLASHSIQTSPFVGSALTWRATIRLTFQDASAPATACEWRGCRRGRRYSTRAAGDTHNIALIETPKAIDNIDELLAVEGVDVFFIGPGDLSQ